MSSERVVYCSSSPWHSRAPVCLLATGRSCVETSARARRYTVLIFAGNGYWRNQCIDAGHRALSGQQAAEK
jgi:hypothetical protein